MEKKRKPGQNKEYILREKKETIIIEALRHTLCNISEACRQAEITRATFYTWYKDPESDFKQRVDEMHESQVDFVESKLLQRIREGSDASIIFYLKSKGKERGYGNNIDVTTNGKDISTIKIIKIINKEDIGEDDDDI